MLPKITETEIHLTSWLQSELLTVKPGANRQLILYKIYSVYKEVFWAESVIRCAHVTEEMFYAYLPLIFLRNEIPFYENLEHKLSTHLVNYALASEVTVREFLESPSAHSPVKFIDGGNK